jgi:ferritin
MPATRFVEQLNVQIGHEFAAHQQYVACAVYYDALTMPQMARFFYAQALEERDHAMMMIKYLIDQDAPVIVPGVSAPQVEFSDVVAPVELALEQERRVTALINELTKIARDESDFASDQFMQWFIKEQVEEVATMSDLVAVARRARDNIEAIEEYVQREQRRDSADPTAPGGDNSGGLLRLTIAEVAHLVLCHLLTLVDLLDVLISGFVVEHVAGPVNAGINFVFLAAKRVLRLVEDAHHRATFRRN